MQGDSPVVLQPDLLYDNLSIGPQHELVQRDPSLKVTISWCHRWAADYEKEYHAEVVKYSACIQQMSKLWIENMMAGDDVGRVVLDQYLEYLSLRWLI